MISAGPISSSSIGATSGATSPDVSIAISGNAATGYIGNVAAPSSGSSTGGEVSWTTPAALPNSGYSKSTAAIVPAWQAPVVDTNTGKWSKEWYPAILRLFDAQKAAQATNQQPLYIVVSNLDNDGFDDDGIVPYIQAPTVTSTAVAPTIYVEPEVYDFDPMPPGAAINRGNLYNASTVAQSGFATDTYLAGSAVALNGRQMAASMYRATFDVTKTAAGTAAPVISVRFGVNGSTADTAQATLTFASQTADADAGCVEITVVFRAIGSSAVVQATGKLWHGLANLGLSTSVTSVALSTSGAFDATPPGMVVGLSVNAGGSATWTIQGVTAELINLS